MNDGLTDALRHNSWVSNELLQRSKDLTDEQLDTVVPGVYGSIIATFRHYIRSEAGYYRRLTGDEPEWLRTEDAPDIAELIRRNNEMAGRWERFLEQPFDAERTHEMQWHDGTTRDVPSGVVLAQVIHHGSDHRSQICTMLTVLLGEELPPMGLWDWAEATGRARVR